MRIFTKKKIILSIFIAAVVAFAYIYFYQYNEMDTNDNKPVDLDILAKRYNPNINKSSQVEKNLLGEYITTYCLSKVYKNYPSVTKNLKTEAVYYIDLTSYSLGLYEDVNDMIDEKVAYIKPNFAIKGCFSLRDEILNSSVYSNL